MLAFVLTKDDLYRKPRTHAWKLLESEYNGGVTIDLAASKYCGDAAGVLAINLLHL